MPFVKIFSILFYECRFFNRSFSEMQLYIKLFVAQQNYGGQWHLCVGKQVFACKMTAIGTLSPHSI